MFDKEVEQFFNEADIAAKAIESELGAPLVCIVKRKDIAHTDMLQLKRHQPSLVASAIYSVGASLNRNFMRNYRLYVVLCLYAEIKRSEFVLVKSARLAESTLTYDDVKEGRINLAEYNILRVQQIASVEWRNPTALAPFGGFIKKELQRFSDVESIVRKLDPHGIAATLARWIANRYPEPYTSGVEWRALSFYDGRSDAVVRKVTRAANLNITVHREPIHKAWVVFYIFPKGVYDEAHPFYFDIDCELSVRDDNTIEAGVNCWCGIGVSFAVMDKREFADVDSARQAIVETCQQAVVQKLDARLRNAMNAMAQPVQLHDAVLVTNALARALVQCIAYWSEHMLASFYAKPLLVTYSTRRLDYYTEERAINSQRYRINYASHSGVINIHLPFAPTAEMPGVRVELAVGKNMHRRGAPLMLLKCNVSFVRNDQHHYIIQADYMENLDGAPIVSDDGSLRSAITQLCEQVARSLTQQHTSVIHAVVNAIRESIGF